MANSISGKIISLSPVQSIQGKSGTIVKREVVIKALRFDPETGEPHLSDNNTPLIEAVGDNAVKIFDSYQVGDCVNIKFTLDGTSYTDEQSHTTKYFTRVRAYAVAKINNVQ